MDNLKIKLQTHHFKHSPGYIFDDCPLKLALIEIYPKAFILIGGSKVSIIYNKKEDKDVITYQVSEAYDPGIIDKMIRVAKEGGESQLEVTLTFTGKEHNYFADKVNEDYMNVPTVKVEDLPPDLFSQ